MDERSLGEVVIGVGLLIGTWMLPMAGAKGRFDGRGRIEESILLFIARGGTIIPFVSFAWLFTATFPMLNWTESELVILLVAVVMVFSLSAYAIRTKQRMKTTNVENCEKM